MIDICTSYGNDFDVNYNEKKSMAMCMAKEREMPNCDVTLNATPLQVCTTIKHLGILLNYDLSQRKDIQHKRGEFIGKANYVLSKFKYMACPVKCKLIQSYCCAFYGSETWMPLQAEPITKAWNVAIRHAYSLPNKAHRYILPILAKHSPLHMMNSKFMTLYKTMMMTKNNLVKSMYNKCVNDYTSLIYTNYCHRFYSVDIDFNVLSDSQCSCINMIYELRNVTVPGFNSDEKDFTVNYLSTCTV
jgi:hypothetical protein